MYECQNCGETFMRKDRADYHSETCEPMNNSDGYSNMAEIIEPETETEED